jgi:RimJ/RimL family protein N-acetyltransferase
VRLYDIEGDRFTWGSWILDANKPPKAALESAVLIYDIGFRAFGKARAVFDVRRDNARTLAFHRRFGATETGTDDQNVYFTYPRDRFLADRPSHLAVVRSAACIA